MRLSTGLLGLGAPLQKFEIANHLAKCFGLKRYLEICTPFTGFEFRRAAGGGQCERYDRLMYKCPENFDDGQPIAFRTSQGSSRELIRNLRAAFDQRPMYDIIFVDPWHTLGCSEEDLAGAWRLLRSGGVMVVHDCNPHAAEIALPSAPDQASEWCGVTYQAYIEFAMSGLASEAYTIDSDYGVGVVFKAGRGTTNIAPVRAHEPHWRLVRNDDAERFAYFAAHRRTLLNLISVQEFLARFPAPDIDVAQQMRYAAE